MLILSVGILLALNVRDPLGCVEEEAVAAEVKLKPGWLIEDVRKASERFDEWTSDRALRAQLKSDREHFTASEEDKGTAVKRPSESR